MLNLCKNDGQLEPPPDQVDLETGKSMWLIDGYKIWAESYQQAVKLYSIILKF